MIKIGATICINISSPDGTQLMLPCDGITSSGRVAQPPTGKHGGCPILRAICARRVGGRLPVTRHCFHDARAENEIFLRLKRPGDEGTFTGFPPAERPRSYAASRCSQNFASNAWLVNLTKSSRRNPIKHGKRNELKRVSPLLPNTSL